MGNTSALYHNNIKDQWKGRCNKSIQVSEVNTAFIFDGWWVIRLHCITTTLRTNGKEGAIKVFR